MDPLDNLLEILHQGLGLHNQGATQVPSGVHTVTVAFNLRQTHGPIFAIQGGKDREKGYTAHKIDSRYCVTPTYCMQMPEGVISLQKNTKHYFKMLV